MRTTLLSLFTFHLILFTSSASDWPQFRGINSSGYAADETIPSEPKEVWSASLPGRGLSSPIIIGDKVFLTASSGPRQETLHVLCFKTSDGSKLWERQLKATGRTMSHSKTSVAAPTPCSDGKRVFAIWSCNDLAAFDLEGNLVWLRGLTADYPNVSNSLGMASSPIRIGEALIVPVENDSESYTIGIDASTGRNLWKLERPKAANWSSPIAWQDGSGKLIAVLQSKDGLLAVDPNSGSRLWEYKDGAATMASSVAGKEAIYAVSHGITALAPTTTGEAPKQLWRAEQVNPGTASPVLIGENLYALNSAGVLVKAASKDGERGWKLRMTGPFSGSAVAAGHQIVAVSEKGLVQIVDVTAPEGAITGKLDLKDQLGPNENILCTPSISGNALYLRGDGHLWKLGQ